jgi:hypothetical protein
MPYVRKTSNLHISEDLREILKKISNESKLAKLLLTKRHKVENLVENHVNFIGLSKSDKSKISYLTIDRIEKMDPSEYWSSSRRYQIKPGGLISKIFKNISNQDIEIFSNSFKSISIEGDMKFEIVEGDNIRKFYDGDYYSSNYGSLGNSCMKYDKCQKYLDIYVKNTGTIKMLVMLNNDGYLMGRSLLWHNGDTKVMDRIYTENDEMLSGFFKRWADKNGYMYKKNQNWNTSMMFINKGKEELHQLSFKIEGDYNYYPYFDTFKFYNTSSNLLYNYNPGQSDVVILCSPDGDCLPSDYLLEDDIDRNYYYSGDMINLQYCDITVNRNKCVYSDVNDCYILKEDSIFEENLRDYIFNQNFEMLNSKTIRERIEKIMKKNSEKQEGVEYYSNVWQSFGESIFLYDRPIQIQTEVEPF